MQTDMTLPAVIRSIRKGRHMTTSEFARSLELNQSMVSRYEKGERSPGWRVLARLLLLAEGREKNVIVDAMSAAKGQTVSIADAEQQAVQAAKEDEFLKRALEHVNLPERARFAYLSTEILQQKREVDASLNQVLSIWLRYGGSAESERYFIDAARFLEIALVPGCGETTQALVQQLEETGLFGDREDSLGDEKPHISSRKRRA